ncbi:MAG: T9SS type A sorting domain-containing protein [Ignavibacteria bacterium]|nr:T9SS type A sorting domain-containing protein [Ignavibacteria bacterium]
MKRITISFILFTFFVLLIIGAQGLFAQVPFDGQSGVSLTTTYTVPAGLDPAPLVDVTSYDMYLLNQARDAIIGGPVTFVYSNGGPNVLPLVGGLANNTTYSWGVWTLGANPLVPPLNPPLYGYFDFTTVIASPILTAPSGGATGVSILPTVTWTFSGGTTGVTFQIELSADGGTNWSNVIDGLGGATTSYTFISSLNYNTAYVVRVHAKKTGEANKTSSENSFTTILGPPTTTAASGTNLTSFTANWTAHANGGATGYKLDVSAVSNFASYVAGYVDLDVGNVLLKAVTGLNGNTTYYYRVRAYDASYTSSNSNTTSVTTTNTGPSLTAPINGITGASVLPTMTWGAVTGAVSYKLYVDDASDFLTPLYAVDQGTNLTRTFTALIPNFPLANGTMYYWKVAAIDNNNNEYASSTYHFTIAPAFTVSQHTPTTGQAIQSTTVDLGWSTGHSANGLTFVIQYMYASAAPTVESDWSGATSTIVTGNSNSSFTKQLTGLTLGKTYYWRVLIRRTSNSEYVHYPSPTTYNYFYTEGGLTVTVTPNWPTGGVTVYTTSPRLDWILSGYYSGLTYEIDYGPGGVDGTADVTGITDLYYTLSGLIPDTTYYWKVRAIYSGNPTAWSAAATFVTFGSGALEVPTCNYPRDGETIYSNTPRLDWVLTTNGDGLTYQICYVLSAADPGVDGNGRLVGATNYPAAVGSFSSNKYLTSPTLTPGSTYWWQVRSYSAARAALGLAPYSAWSARTYFVNNGPGTLVVPTPNYPIDGVTVYSTSPTLYWYLSPYSTGLTYEIDFGTSVDGTPEYTNITSMNYQVTGLTPGTTYLWRVRSKNSLGSTSAWSSTVSFVVTGGTTQSYAVASWPTGGATQYTNTPYVSWYLQGSSLGITGYNVKYKKTSAPGSWLTYSPASNNADGGQFLGLSTSTFSQQLGTDFANGLTYGATYYWAVYPNGTTTLNPNGIGWFVVVGGPGTTTIVNSNPSNGSVTNNTTVYFSWYVNGSSLGIVDYELVYSYSDVFDPLATYTVSNITSQTKTITGLTNGTTWFWKVRGRYADNSYTAYSDVFDFTIQEGSSIIVQPWIGGPHNVAISTTSPTFSWRLPVPPASGLKYELEYGENPNFIHAAKVENISNQYANVAGLNANTKYYWRVRSKALDGTYSYYSTVGKFDVSMPTGVDEPKNVPDEFALRQNYPNPFNPSTKISFDLPEAARVTIKVYNTIGQLVATLASNEFLNAGSYERTFDASGLPSGIYIYQLNSDKFNSYKKMLMVK